MFSENEKYSNKSCSIAACLVKRTRQLLTQPNVDEAPLRTEEPHWLTPIQSSVDMTVATTAEYLHVALRGRRGLAELQRTWADLAQAMSRFRHHKLLLDVRDLTGEIPAYQQMKLNGDWRAYGFPWTVKAAIVTVQHKQLLGFAETVLRNRGANVRVFEDFDSAESWLLSSTS